jgi:hypothetical protein
LLPGAENCSPRRMNGYQTDRFEVWKCASLFASLKVTNSPILS